MWGWICLGVGVAAPIIWIVVRARRYNRLFAKDHYLQIAREVPRLKTATLERVILTEEDGVRSPGDPRTMLTRAGLAVVYTIARVDNRFVHHYSVSVAGGYTAGAVGERFVLFIATLVGIPFEQLVLSVVVKSTVHHAEFNLSEEEQAQFVGKAVQESEVADVTNFLGNISEARKHLRWQRITGNSCRL